MAEPILHERDWKGRAWLWRRTLQQARRTVRPNQSLTNRTRTRLGAFARPRQPIFILGCPRSGTTYLGELLEALPGCSYYFEPPLFKYFVRLMIDGGVTSRTVRRTYRVGIRALLFVAPGSGPRVVEKNPNHVFAAERLLEFFPDAQFVIITRDGRDVTASLADKPWHRMDAIGSGDREPGGYLYGPYPHFYIEESRRTEYRETSDIHRCVWIWRRHQETIEQLKCTLPDAAQHHLRYEDLVTNPQDTLLPLLDFLDIEDRHRAPVLAAAAAGRVDSIGRWKKSVAPSDVDVMQAEAGELLAHLHYV